MVYVEGRLGVRALALRTAAAEAGVLATERNKLLLRLLAVGVL
jgi:hypothetical protein